jgi:hypothetical protein
LAIAELLLSAFAFDRVWSHFRDPVSDFSFSENCRMLIRDRLASVILSRDPLRQCPEVDLEPPERVLERPPYFVVEQPSLIPQIRHVVLELRKLATQTSATMMNCVLTDTMNYLVGAICPSGTNVGADESFQFFVAALAEAQLFALPTVLKILENLVVQDLRPSKATFLASQLRIAVQFIQSRSISVPPFLILPYIDRESGAVALESEDRITLPCFAVFARPFTIAPEVAPPAILRCTGDPVNQAIVYRHRLIPGREPRVEPYYSSLATPEGSLCYVESNEAVFQGFIRIDTGAYEDRIEDIRVISNLNVMLPPNEQGFDLALVHPMKRRFAQWWRRDQAADVTGDIFAEVRKMQVALKKLKCLPDGFEESGVLDSATLEAIDSIAKLRAIRPITAEVVLYLCTLADQNVK